MEHFDPTITVIVLLLAAAFVAGYIDTLVGGGGLITIPALMAAGLPPIMALGTNKLQAVAGSATATITLLSQSKIKFFDVKWLMVAAFIGSLVGATAVQFIDTDVLNWVIPSVIMAIGAYFIITAKKKVVERPPLLTKKAYGLTAVPVVGFYDGMFGPGTGSFFVWAGVALKGQAIVRSTMTAKALNFSTNLAALIVFTWFGKIAWGIGLSMMLGQALGAHLGAKSLMTVNPMLC